MVIVFEVALFEILEGNLMVNQLNCHKAYEANLHEYEG
jgi:hypothetical protein